MMCSSVDLPEPDGPTTAASSPSSHGERDAVQDVDRAGIGLADAGQLEDRAHRAVTTVWPSLQVARRPRRSRRRTAPARPPRSCGRRRPTTSTANPPPCRASSALTGTASTSSRRSTAKPTSTGAWSRPVPRAALPRSAIVTSIVGSPCSSSAGCSATLPTSHDRPAGAAARRQLDGHARRPRAPAAAGSRPGRPGHAPRGGGHVGQRGPGRHGLPGDRLRLADPRRPGAEHDLALARASRPPSSPCSSWKRWTAAVVAQSHSSSTVRSPSGSCPSARRLRSSWRMSPPSSIHGSKSRQAGRRP